MKKSVAIAANILYRLKKTSCQESWELAFSSAAKDLKKSTIGFNINKFRDACEKGIQKSYKSK